MPSFELGWWFISAVEGYRCLSCLFAFRVELDSSSIRPVAWWVRYSRDKQRRVLKFLASTASSSRGPQRPQRGPPISRVGTADVWVREAVVQEVDPRRFLAPVGGQRVLLESEQELSVDKVKEAFHGEPSTSAAIYHFNFSLKRHKLLMMHQHICRLRTGCQGTI